MRGSVLLIVPIGIEIFFVFLPVSLEEALLIVPIGIEINIGRDL